MLLLSFQPLQSLGAIELALVLLFALAFRIMFGGSTHSRLLDMVKRHAGAAEASGTPPFGPTQKSPKLEPSNSANSRNSLKNRPQTEKPSQLPNGHQGESNGPKGASSNGRKGASSNGLKGASSNGYKGESSNGIKGESSNGITGVSNGIKGASNDHKGKSSQGCSDDEPSGSSSESGLTVDSLLRLKHDTAPASSKSSNVDPRIGPLEKECEKLILNEEVTPPSSEVLPPECIHLILGLFNWRLAVQLLGELGKNYRNFISHPAFVQSRPKAEGEYSPISFMVDANDDLLWYGFNTKSRNWESLPSLNFAKDTVLPSPDPDLFKDYLVAGDGGLLCFNVGKSTGRESLVVCNPLTRQVKQLPPLNYPRHPVLMHFRIVDNDGNYRIVVAGSAATGTEDVSRKTEEYDSRTGRWECPEGSDMPCLPFGLNEYQNGVQIGDDLLLCGAIIDTRGRGMLIYDLKKKTWLQDHRKLHIPLVRSPESNVGHLATSQLVECGGRVYVFSEQECGREVFFVIHELNLDGLESNPWNEINCRKRMGGRGLLVYPEFTCSAVSGHELAIFNTVEHTMEIVDLNKASEVASLRSVPSSKANRFHSLNPIGFSYRPSFRSLVCPGGRHPNSRCTIDLKQGQYCSECERRNSDSGSITVKRPPVANNHGIIAESPLPNAEPSPRSCGRENNGKPRAKTRGRKGKKGMRSSLPVKAPVDCFT